MTVRFASVAVGLFTTFATVAAGTDKLPNTEIRGLQLAQRIRQQLEQPPAQNQTNSGILTIDDEQGHRLKIPVEFRTEVGATRWSSIFETLTDSNRVRLSVIHEADKPNQYEFSNGSHSRQVLTGNETMVPFAGSDFWVADLGLQFFYWPDQKILKEYEMRRGRACHVLESINPDPSADSYSRVDSWIDNETLGIVQAFAYDAKGKLWKEFYPKDFRKVNGQWEVGEMEMINDRTGSGSWIKFNLKNRD